MWPAPHRRRLQPRSRVPPGVRINVKPKERAGLKIQLIGGKYYLHQLAGMAHRFNFWFGVSHWSPLFPNC